MIRGLSVMIDGDILSDFLEYIFLSRFSSSTKHYMPVRVGDGIAQDREIVVSHLLFFFSHIEAFHCN